MNPHIALLLALGGLVGGPRLPRTLRLQPRPEPDPDDEDTEELARRQLTAEAKRARRRARNLSRREL